jgi:hypothetical protein
MSDRKGSNDLQGLFGALLGGMMASFVAAAVFWALLGGNGAVRPNSALLALLIGFGAAIAFMVGGLYATDRLPWLGGALLFASGFTTLWCVGASLGLEQKWVVLAGLGIAIAIGVILGGRRFGAMPRTTGTGNDEIPAL